MSSSLQSLENAVHAIDPTRWENSLAIGSFQNLVILRTLNVRNSHIAVCRITGARGNATAYVKLMHGIDTVERRNIADDARNEYETLRFWHGKFADSPRFHTLQPLFALPDDHIVATLECPGQVLADCLAAARFFPSRKGLAKLNGSLRATGGWLRHFQAIRTEQDTTGEYSIEQMKDYLDRRLKILVEEKNRRFPARYRDRILKHLDRHRHSVPPKGLRLSLTHGDFNLSNILINGDEVTVFDFGQVIPDSHLLDAARIFHQLYLFTLKPWNRSAVFKKLQQAFLDGFGEPAVARQLIFRMILIRHTITHLVTITQFYEQSPAEQVYNLWVLAHELKLLDQLLAS